MADEATNMTSGHPDANQLAAFAERRLLPDERQEILTHLAKCADCREVLALVSAPVQQPVSPRSVSLWWRTASGVAAAALIIAAGLGLRQALRSPEESNARQMTADLKTQVAAKTPPPLLAAAPEIKNTKPERPIVAAPKRSIAPARSMAAGARATSADSVSQGRESASASFPEPPSTPVAPVAQPPSPVIAPLPEAPAPTAAAVPERQAMVEEESKSAHFAPGSFGRFGLKTAKARVSKPAVMWRIDAQAVERSFDGGKSWELVPFNGNANLHAVAADASGVWAGGSRGMLFHSSDGGAHWMQIVVRDQAHDLTGTIVSIRLPQPSEIVLETDSGEQWISRDGGTEWQRL